MADVLDSYFTEFIDACRRVVDHGLLRCSSGNLSWRINDEHLLITGTSTWMEAMTREHVALCRLSDGASLNGVKASKEIGFHAGVLRERPTMHVVLHCQSPHATVLACTDRAVDNVFVTPEIPYYIRPVAAIPYEDPGSVALADGVTNALKGHDMVILRNHGQVTVGEDFNDAIQRACFFDMACDIILRADERLTALSDEAVRLVGRSTKKAHKHGA